MLRSGWIWFTGVALGVLVVGPARRADAQAVAFAPTVGTIPDGVSLNAVPAVSADRRYVRLSVNANFTTVNSIQNFGIPFAVSGLNSGGGGSGRRSRSRSGWSRWPPRNPDGDERASRGRSRSFGGDGCVGVADERLPPTLGRDVLDRRSLSDRRLVVVPCASASQGDPEQNDPPQKARARFEPGAEVKAAEFEVLVSMTVNSGRQSHSRVAGGCGTPQPWF